MTTRLSSDIPLDLPARATVDQGLADLAAGRGTKDAYLVAIASDRLRAAGVAVPSPLPERPKDRLWDLLEEEVGDDAHGRYNALVARIVSFLDAMDAHESAGAEVPHPPAR